MAESSVDEILAGLRLEDVAAVRAAIAALVQDDKCADALRICTGAAPSVQKDLQLEHAYCQFRVHGKVDTSLLRPSDGASSMTIRGLQHLEVLQALGAEDFDRAVQLLEEIVREGNALVDNEGAETLSNLLAARSQAFGYGNDNDVESDDHNVLYNRACVELSCGKLAAAESLLLQAKEAVQALSFDTEAEKYAEMVPIMSQLAYLYLETGRQKDALTLLTETLGHCPDPTSWTTVMNNIVVAESDISGALRNPFALYKKIAPLKPRLDSLKLYKQQSFHVARNIAALELEVGVLPRVVKEGKAAGLGDVTAAYLQERMPKGTRGAFLRANRASVAATLSTLQTGTNHANLETAMLQLQHDLANEPDVLHSPRVVACAVAVYANERPYAAYDALVLACRHWRPRQAESPEAAASFSAVAKGLAYFCIKRGINQHAALRTLQAVSEVDRETRLCVDALQVILHGGDGDAVRRECAPLALVLQDVDTDALERQGVVRMGERRRQTDTEARVTKRLRRKRILPKNYDPKATADPERWLKIKDRTSYRMPAVGKGGKKGRSGGKGKNKKA